MSWYHEAPHGVRVVESSPLVFNEPAAWKGPFSTLRAARDDAIVHFQWEKKAIESKIKFLRAIDLRCQPKGAKR